MNLGMPCIVDLVELAIKPSNFTLISWYKSLNSVFKNNNFQNEFYRFNDLSADYFGRAKEKLLL
jgi:hypothetical protein